MSLLLKTNSNSNNTKNISRIETSATNIRFVNDTVGVWYNNAYKDSYKTITTD